MELIAHRGCAEQYPENTLHAIERSARELAAVEIDVRRCQSGELVVFHDETVDRLTDDTGPVAGMNWTQLSALDVLDSGHSIPRLADALAAVPSDVPLQVELKQAGIASDVVEVIHDADVNARVTSFLPEALTEVRECDPNIPVGYLFGEAVGVETGLKMAEVLDCDSVHPHASLCLETDVVERVRADGRDVIAWGVGQRDTFEELRSVGVDAATSDWASATSEPEAPLAT
ncbi:glycerophosphodiester phosphodiesterase [Halobacterium zhouii]|uniref:glycerophosphodiester phosphodiesterase n=1 Tax=Halobacterium zhouii TaxID=2902624 RepID=UPI001E5C0428|nr:glycerophosphodiester phosphodiesterase [Halobacterium zhouii]